DRVVFQATAPTQGVVLRGGSAILARATPPEATGGQQAKAAGRAAGEPLTARGGDIEISANAVLLCPDCVINADGPTTSSGGSVVINNPETAIESQIAPPKVSYLDASDRLMARCGDSQGSDARAAGRFTVSDWPAIPFASDGSMLAFSPLGNWENFGIPKAARNSGESSDTYSLAMLAGDEALRTGRAAEASQEFQQARQTASAAGNVAAHADALRGLGVAEHAAGAYSESAGHLEAAVTSAQVAGDPAREAAALGALARVYSALGQSELAETSLSDAVDLSRANSFSTKREKKENAGAALSPDFTAALLNQLGGQRSAMGNSRGALAAFRQSAGVASQADDFLGVAQAATNAARAALAADEPKATPGSLARARQALAQAEASPRQRTALLIAFAQTESALAQQDPSSRRKALRAAHGDLIRADREAREQGDLRTASYAIGNLGALYHQEGGREQEALRLTRRAIFLADEARAGDLIARWYAQLGQINRQTGQVDLALTAYRRAVGLLERTRPEAPGDDGSSEAAFRQAVEPIYLALVDILLESSPQAESAPERQERLAEARNVIEQWKAAELRNYFQDRCAAEVESLSLESVDPGAAVVYPIALPDRLELLVSRQAGIERFSVPIPRTDLETQVAEFRSLLMKRSSREYKRPARQLYNSLVKPYLSLLKAEGIDTLIFVPSGSLRTIPMAALHDGEQFLLENYSLGITPSLNLLAPTRLDPRKADILLVGLSESVQGYPALPGVSEELASIEELYGGRILLNDNFDPQQLESELTDSPPGILHIASHAEFTGNPDTSFVLTHSDRLPMEKLSSLIRHGRYGDEPVELLILSACQTAIGDERAALGLAGVAVRAGARSAMGSLWSVSDDATSRLTLNFYRELGNAEASKARALQQAQLLLLADPSFEHPFYWAPFLLINNWL
ncbi:MAG TPA: CHAT domain-containing protein, partial [Myxococcales bacterium]|nr:CHAT domain-containing protein [Myxococcales bacterium]